VKFLVWIKEKRGRDWVEIGEGELTKKTADRIAGEIRHDCGIPVKVCAVGFDPNPIRDDRCVGESMAYGSEFSPGLGER
jgi:hypothetical protein